MGNVRLTALTAIALAVSAATPASAHLVGATYDFSASTTGNTTIFAPAGTFTDPANAGFCIGPPLACGDNAGVSGSFSFADVSPNMSTITFGFSGSTDGAGPGSFTIDLSNFITTDGEKITGITYASGNLLEGNFTNVVWDGKTASFGGFTTGDYSAVGGVNVVFDVTTSSVPEPATWALMTMGFLGVGFVAYRRGAKAGFARA